MPRVAPSAFIAPNATLIGDVEIAANANIWFGCILRGDGPGIRIGENSNLQDGTVVHVASRGLMTTVGRNVTVGHMVLLHACEVQDGAFVGMHVDRARRCGGRDRGDGRGRRGGDAGARSCARASCRPATRRRELRDLTEKTTRPSGASQHSMSNSARAYRGGEQKAADDLRSC